MRQKKLRWWKGLLQIMMGRDESPVDDHTERERELYRPHHTRTFALYTVL